MRLRAGFIHYEATSRLTSDDIVLMETAASVTLPTTEVTRIHELAFAFAELREMQMWRPENRDYVDLLGRLSRLADRPDPAEFLSAVEDLAYCDEEDSPLKVHALEGILFELSVSAVDVVCWRERVRTSWDGQRIVVQQAIGSILRRQRATYKNKKGRSRDNLLYPALYALAGVWQRIGEPICRSTSHSAQQGHNQAYTRRSRFACFAKPFVQTVIGYDGDVEALSELVHKQIKQLRSAKSSVRRRLSKRIDVEA